MVGLNFVTWDKNIGGHTGGTGKQDGTGSHREGHKQIATSPKGEKELG